MERGSRHFFEFDEFRVDVDERRLLRNDAALTVASRDFDILLALLERAGQTVDKNDLMEMVWQDTFVEEGNLNRHVSTLRKILGDDPREQRLIKTLPKRGYRFTANVREMVETDETVAIENVSRGRLVIKEETSEGFWTTTRFALACVSIIGLALVGWLALTGSSIRGSSDAGEARSASGSAAADLYYRGRELWQTRQADDLHNATSLLEQARDIDPEFALARAALADAYAFDYSNWAKAEAEAREAIRLDPALGQPHATIGFVKMFWEWKVRDAEQDFKTATTLSPDYATGFHWYALNLAAASRGDAALVEIEKALALEPASVPINTDRCQLLYFAERYQDAALQCERVLTMDPESLAARELLYLISMSRGRHDEAVDRFVDLVSLSKSDRVRAESAGLKRAYTDGGIDSFRKAQIRFYTAVDPSSYKLARVLAEMGDNAGAVEHLKLAVARKDFDMIFFEPDPAFASLRTGPVRFQIPGRPL